MKGTLNHRGDRHVLRFERRLAHPPEKVWHALVDDGELVHWFPAKIEGRWEVGARLQYAWTPQDESNLTADAELEQRLVEEQQKVPAEEMQGEVRIVDRPRVLEYTWAKEVLRFELTPTAEGTLLVFTHTFDDRSIAASAAAGWTACFDALAHRLAGELPRTQTAAEMKAVEAEYRAQFGD